MALNGLFYTIRYEKGNRVVYEDGFRKLSEEEVAEYDQGIESKWETSPVVCFSCGKHDYTKLTKTKKPRKKKCPDCGELMEVEYSVGVKKDESQVRRMVQKFNHEGYNKDQAKQFYDSSIEGTSRRIQGVGGAQHYKQMLPDMDYMVKNGVAKPLDTEDAAKRQQARKEVIVKHTAGKKNFKANRSNNTQSIK